MGQDTPRIIEYGRLFGPKKEGETQIVRHPIVGNGPLWSSIEPGLDTMIKVLQNSVKRYPNRHMFATREKISEDKYSEYKFKTYLEVDKLVIKFAKGVYLLNLCPEIQTKSNGLQKFLGIYSKNKEEWLISDMGSHLNSIAVVPIYDTLGDSTISFILNETQMTTIALETEGLLKIIKIAESKQNFQLKNLILFDRECGEDLINKAKKVGYNIFDFNEIIHKGDTIEEIPLKQCEPESLAVLSYTSGTTGQPKGTMLTHLQLISQIQTLPVLNVILDYNEVYMSYLPLAHVFERVINLMCIYIGATIAFYSGNTKRLMEDAQLIKPTVFIAVPRVIERMYEGIMNKINGSSKIVKLIFNRAYNDKLNYLRKTGIYTHAFWDNIIFQKTRELIGGRLRAFVIAGAPLTQRLTESMKIFFSAPVIIGYGQTEISGAGLISHGDDNLPCTVGGCLASAEYKLIDLPELGYTTKDINKENGQPEPRGEILLRGFSVFKSYFNNEELTKKALDDEGWLHTGDVGALLTWHGNVLKVIDRAKAIFKLSQGEYIAPEKIENELIKSKYVKTIFVTGNSTEKYIVAIIVPDKNEIKKFLISNNILIITDGDDSKNNEEVLKFYDNENLLDEILKDLDKTGRSNGLKGFEIAKQVYLSRDEFTVDNGLITPTLKLRRVELRKKFKTQVEELYSKPIKTN